MNSIHVIIGGLNILLIFLILYYFYQTYREVKSKFALGLVLFAFVLLINGFFIFPMFYELFTTSHTCPYDPYYTIAGGLELIALLILLKLVKT